MLRAVLICPDEQMSRELGAASPQAADLEIIQTLKVYPSPEDLLRTIRVRKVDLLLLSVDELVPSEVLAKCIDDTMPGFPVITVSKADGAAMLEKLMHLGIREHLTSPVSATALAQAVAMVRQRMKAHPTPAPVLGDLYTFLPAKAGVGTSTIALSASCALADDLTVKTLLLDCDLAAGTIQFLLKLGSTPSIVDALMHASSIEDMWPQMVGKWEKLDVVHAGELDSPPGMEVPGIEHIIAVARAQYDVICADLGSQFDPLSIAMLRESRRIFLVTTPELAPLHLAKIRMRRLIDLGLGDRVSLLLNRKAHSLVTDEEVAVAVGIPVSYRFSNDYRAVQDSVLRASPVQQRSELGESILNLAHAVAPKGQAKPTGHTHKFLEFFHVSRGNEGDTDWRG